MTGINSIKKVLSSFALNVNSVRSLITSLHSYNQALQPKNFSNVYPDQSQPSIIRSVHPSTKRHEPITALDRRNRDAYLPRRYRILELVRITRFSSRARFPGRSCRREIHYHRRRRPGDLRAARADPAPNGAARRANYLPRP